MKNSKKNKPKLTSFVAVDNTGRTYGPIAIKKDLIDYIKKSYNKTNPLSFFYIYEVTKSQYYEVNHKIEIESVRID